MFYLNDTSGKKSLTATLAVVSFIVVMVKVLLSGASVSLGAASYSFGSIDGFTIGAIFGPILGSYTARRWNGNGQAPDPAADVSAGGKPGDGGQP